MLTLQQLFAFFAFLAAANAGIILPETKIETIPIVKTNIHGPSGEITQEEHLPVITHHEPATILESHPVVRLHDVPVVVAPEVVHHHEVSVVHPTEVVVPHVPIHHEVLPIQPIVHHELPLVVPHEIAPIHHELPLITHHELPLVQPHVPLVHPIPEQPVWIKSVPHTIPLYNVPHLYKNLYYH